ncbi:hypothetical protein MKW98_003527 [Papaver atlanticum]|uniref:Uncharacterized protein n=1 Tax=Papaver atlanticum TaxID=357466 RepID=A0AAD4XTT9_9MAGN|nr:hypothetical protein MKW98_003527 [Papaver atlanticum]
MSRSVRRHCLPYHQRKQSGKQYCVFQGKLERVCKGLEVKRAATRLYSYVLADGLANAVKLPVGAYVFPGTAIKSDHGTRLFNYIK